MGTVLLMSARELDSLLSPVALIDAVEAAFCARGLGAAQPGGVLGVELARGGFHVKTAALGADQGSFAAKLNTNFPGNPEANGLPTIQGVVLVADVATGEPQAILESGSITRLRTAAASAVAVRHLANDDANTLTLIGCGAQAFDQVRFAHAVRPLRIVTAFDSRVDVAAALVARLGAELGIIARAGDDLGAACAESAIIVTCTSSRLPVLHDSLVPPGALVVAVGADNPHKHEIYPALMAHAVVITDDTAQCATIGDLHHAIAAGAMTVDDVRAELGEVIAGVRTGRRSREERIVFDSTGTPIQDAAAASLVLALAESSAGGARTRFSFRE